MNEPVTWGQIAFAVLWVCAVVVGIQVFAPRLERWWYNRKPKP